MKSKIAFMMLLPVAVIYEKERNGEYMILLNGTVIDYISGTVMGTIKDDNFTPSPGKFTAKFIPQWDNKIRKDNN